VLRLEWDGHEAAFAGAIARLRHRIAPGDWRPGLGKTPP
jgi:hypothetical protein